MHSKKLPSLPVTTWLYFAIICILQVTLCASCIDYSQCSSIEEVLELETQQIQATSFLSQEDGSLQNISSVVIIPFVSTKTKAEDEKISSFIRAELAKMGAVKQINICNGSLTLDFSQLSNPSLIYELQPLQSISGKPLSVMRASLNLSGAVSRSEKFYTTYIWGVNCFWEKDSTRTLEQQIRLSFPYLIAKFMESYKIANPSRKEPLAFLVP